MSFEAELRSVRGVWSEAATAKAAVMPGMISNGIVGGAEGFYFFIGATENERVAGFEAQDGAVLPRRSSSISCVNAGLRDVGLAAAFADRDDERGGAGTGRGFRPRRDRQGG